MNNVITIKKQLYAGVFLIALSTLMYEILLTRIFSVTMWYHFAFMAISIAMFGMTFGSILVYLYPNYFRQDRNYYYLGISALLFAVSAIISTLLHVVVPVFGGMTTPTTGFLVLTYIAVSIPFVFSGICICIALTKFPQNVSKLYAADLIGAALGCIFVIFALEITDGPTAVIGVAFLASGGAFLFFTMTEFKKLKTISVLMCLLFMFFFIGNTFLVGKQSSLLSLRWTKGEQKSKPLYEQWNSFSRVIVSGDPNSLRFPLNWEGLSEKYPPEMKVRQLYMTIDASAGTQLTAFDGNFDKLEFLRYEISNLSHYIRPDSKVFIIGAGGGKDVLAALAFGQKSITAVEINEDILDIVNGTFGDFTGHLDTYQNVTFINEEARSYISSLQEKFDVIQASLVDTWAATSSGSYVMMENSLYTVEAWHTFLNHLTPSGLLTFSRWYVSDSPMEMYRLIALATVSLRAIGIENPRDHIIVAGNTPQGSILGLGTILVSRQPFSDKEINLIEDIAKEMWFKIILSPRSSIDGKFSDIVSREDFTSFEASFPINISPPTDDSPFFFHMVRFKDVFKRLYDPGPGQVNTAAVTFLAKLLVIILILTFLCILLPIRLSKGKLPINRALPLVIYFAAIGLGFMLIEISQLQRLIIFLGHPTYSLSVVLFTLLLSGGLGSYLTNSIKEHTLQISAYIRLFFLILILLVFGIFTSYIIRMFQSSEIFARIFAGVLVLFPLGIFMGMAFPLGLKLASAKDEHLTPWLWGINGATSVCGSVLAVAIALELGISFAFWTGLACYCFAFLAFIWATRSRAVQLAKVTK